MKSLEQLRAEHRDKVAAAKQAKRDAARSTNQCSHPETINLGLAIRNGEFKHEIIFCKTCQKYVTQA